MKEPCNRNLRIRLTEIEEKIVLDLCAMLHEKSRSRVVRRMIREAGGQGPDLLGEGMATLREGFRQQAAMGNNLNQIARALNSGQYPNIRLDNELLLVVSAQVGEVKKELMEVILRSRYRWVRLPVGLLVQPVGR